MYVFIVPKATSADPKSPELPINLVAENRTDILLLFLRIIRYLFQNRVCGEKLIWDNDSEKTGIYIEVLSPELIQNTNMRPAVFIDAGEVTYQFSALMDNKASMDLYGKSTKFSQHNITMDLTVVGRNKLESSYIAERIAAALFLITESIKENTKNIETIDNFRVGRPQPLNTESLGPGGDTSLAFLTRVSFSATYFLQFGQMQVGDLFTSMNFKVTSKEQDGSKSDEEFTIESNQVYTKFIR